MDIHHGTERAYRKRKCRCDDCQDWHARFLAAARAKPKTPRPPVRNPSHGTERKYLAGCRCEPCAQAYERKKARNRRHARTYAKTDQHRATRRAWIAAHRDRIRATFRTWTLANIDTVRAYGRTWRATHRAECRAYAKQWALANPEKARAQARAHAAQWRRNHPDKVRAYAAKWRQGHPDKVRAYAAKWQKAHPPAHRPALTTTWPFTRSTDDLDPITAAINAIVPKTLPEHIRQEVAQDLAVTWLTVGAVSPADLEPAIRAVWTRYPLMAGRDISLFAPAHRHGDGRERLIDQLTA